MPLTPGTRLGPYEIVAPIGAGGMGEVYRARDARLGRDVAIKVLPGHMATDIDFRERFEREARAVASLSHPNILALYDVGEADGVRFIVTELIDGEPVCGPFPLRKLLDVATQIAAGLAAAHEAGVVHRDVKPGNLLITRDGRVKILDFGLAIERSLADEGPGVTRAATSPGTVLGTVAYMSPEQARGTLVDARSDQFAFGLVLYELASGRQAFARDSSVQTLSAIIEADADLSPLVTLPVQLRWIIERCLAKDPADRYASTADLYRDLRQLRERQSEIGLSGPQDIVAAPAKRRAVWAPLLVIAAVGGVAAAAFMWLRPNPGVTLDAYRFVPFAVDAGVQSMPAWSPDGQSLAFGGEVDGYYQIFTRRLDQSTASQITKLPGHCLYPAWDASGTRVFFLLTQRVGTSLQTSASEIWMVSAAGGVPERIVTDSAAFGVVPKANSLVFLTPKAPEVADGRYVLRSIDLETRSTRELGPVPITYDRSFNPTGAAIKFTHDGTSLAFVKPGGDQLVIVANPLSGAGGSSRTVRFVPAGGGVVSIFEVDWMPDNRHVVLALRDPLGGDQSVWLGDIDRGTVSRITASSQWETSPTASPDGGRLAFSSTPLDWDIMEFDLASQAPPRPLVASAKYDGWGDWLPDGSGLVFSTQRTGRFEIWERRFHDGSTRVLVTPDAFPGEPSLFLVQAALSADGRSLAYIRYAPTGTRVYVTALAGSRPVQLTSETAVADSDDSPMWSPDGRWILFRRGHQLLKALASGGTKPTPITDEVLNANIKFEGAAQWTPDGRGVIFSAKDGLRHLPAEGGPSRLISSEQPTLWDLSPDGRLIYGIVERERRMMHLIAIDTATGTLRTLRTLDQVPLSPDPGNYPDTVRALRVSPDGKRVMYARLNPTADIWILEGIAGRPTPVPK